MIEKLKGFLGYKKKKKNTLYVCDTFYEYKYVGDTFYEYKVVIGPITGVLNIGCDDLPACSNGYIMVAKMVEGVFENTNQWATVEATWHAPDFISHIDLKYDEKQTIKREENQQTYLKNLKEHFSNFKNSKEKGQK